MKDALEMLRRKYAGRQPGLLGAPRRGAVLCPLVELADGPHLLFEVRAADIPQGGDICFPGGAQMPGETAEACVLRETEEELSIPPGEIRLFGRSDFMPGPRGFLIQPVLGVVSAAGFAAIRPAPSEVAESFTVPLRFFQETMPEIYPAAGPALGDGFPYAAYGIDPAHVWGRSSRTDLCIWKYGRRVIWGLTARIIRDLLQDSGGAAFPQT